LLVRFSKALLSMLRSSQRMQGRSWATELFARYLSGLFNEADARPLSWLRVQVDNGSAPHPVLFKASINQREVAGVNCTLVAPKNNALANTVIVYFHGGGYVVGSPKAYKSSLAQLAVRSNCMVVAPKYRLAPEHPFAAPQDDCLAVAAATIRAYPEHKIVLSGDSAGGALAVATARELAQHKELNQVDALVLISPWVEPTAVGGSAKSNQGNDFLSTSFLGSSFAALMQNEDYTNPRVNFTKVELSGLPKTLIQCGGGELFVDQISSFAQRATAAGVEVQLQNYTGQFHDFQVLVPFLKDSRKAMAEITDFIERV